MTPDQLAKSNTEHAHQVALFAWVAVAMVHGFDIADAFNSEGPTAFKRSSYKAGDPFAFPMLKWLHAIPNGGARGGDKQTAMIRGAQLKAEGVKPGVPDIFLPYPIALWHGLYIEMKKPDQKPVRSGKGGVSDEQLEFRRWALSQNYGWIVCYSWREAADVLKQYILYRG